jgi:hypothetical protein
MAQGCLLPLGAAPGSSGHRTVVAAHPVGAAGGGWDERRPPQALGEGGRGVASFWLRRRSHSSGDGGPFGGGVGALRRQLLHGGGQD